MLPTTLSYLAIVFGLEWIVRKLGETFAGIIDTGNIQLYLILAAIVIGLFYVATMVGIVFGKDLARAAAFTVSGVNLLCCGGLMTLATGAIGPLTELLGAGQIGSMISTVFITLFISQILTVILLVLPNVSRWFAYRTSR